MPLMKGRSLDLLTSSIVRYHCAKDYAKYFVTAKYKKLKYFITDNKTYMYVPMLKPHIICTFQGLALILL